MATDFYPRVVNVTYKEDLNKPSNEKTVGHKSNSPNLSSTAVDRCSDYSKSSSSTKLNNQAGNGSFRQPYRKNDGSGVSPLIKFFESFQK